MSSYDTLSAGCSHSSKRPKIAIIDGQGGGFGVALIKEIRLRFGESLEIWALGANSTATGAMMKARANRGATGDNAIGVCLSQVQAVLGSIAITWPNAMMGEITPTIAEVVCSCQAPKILIPLYHEGIILAGFTSQPLPHLVSEAVNQLTLVAQKQGEFHV